MVRIMFVCTGNTCRSPMAAALLNEKIMKEGMENRMVASSAGLSADEGSRASENSLLVMWECGLSLAEHRAAMLTRTLVEEADLVLTMTAGHKRVIMESMPTAAFKVYTLAEYVGTGLDISDPYGGDLAAYRQCAAAMKKNIILMWDKLRNSVDEQSMRNWDASKGEVAE